LEEYVIKPNYDEEEEKIDDIGLDIENFCSSNDKIYGEIIE